jgi:uncharacterized protein
MQEVKEVFRKLFLITLLLMCSLPFNSHDALAQPQAASKLSHLRLQARAWWHGVKVDPQVHITTFDGTALTATLFRPRKPTEEKLAAIFIQHPYGRLDYGESLRAGQFFAAKGYAVLVADMRGKHGSGGEFTPYRHSTQDGVSTLNWITQQTWSNGRVGTYGCSALGELQYVLARAQHPAHKAMIALGAGGAAGSVAGRYGYFGIFEGGIPQLASAFGWFADNGEKRFGSPKPAPFDRAAILRKLPSASLMQHVSNVPNNFEAFMSTPFTDPWWSTLDYVSKSDVLTTPALVINTWGDQTVGETLAMAQQHKAEQHVVIAPGGHCQSEETGRSGQFGELKVPNAEQPYFDWYLKWFDHHLRNRGPGLAELPAYLYYMMGEGQWLSASNWPPEQAQSQRMYLSRTEQAANSQNGGGVLSWQAPSKPGQDEYLYDPANPTPSVGGPVCCTGSADALSGPRDQARVESRNDVLVYTSKPLDKPLRIAGPLKAMLRVSSSALDTDFMARLSHVWPNGRSTSIQEGALRARFREGFERPTLLKPDQPVNLNIDMRAIAYTLPAGHRLRLQITSSNFPRLERNLNTGGRNHDETQGIIAKNRVFYGNTANPSYLELWALPSSPNTLKPIRNP